MKKSEKIKNGEGPSSGKKRGKETKVSFAFVICKVFGFSGVENACISGIFKVIVLI